MKMFIVIHTCSTLGQEDKKEKLEYWSWLGVDKFVKRGKVLEMKSAFEMTWHEISFMYIYG